ncbi:hypothetical protein BD626DRAFT_416884 [Schizophyllum amplum]|uniref:Uncharacterized protein n=1 Tax=Schizophyllum amplum TaxID=97359 RepID=A0A550BSP8_9AGAR|nr:hypothetical protein BD626DRAFT_416884 [Auriculariopsis ampla]
MAAQDTFSNLLRLVSLSCGYCVVHSLLTHGTLPVGPVQHGIHDCPSIPVWQRALVHRLVADVRYERGERTCYVCHLPSAHHPPLQPLRHHRANHPHASLIPQALWAVQSIDPHLHLSAMDALSVEARGHSWSTPREMAAWIADSHATDEGNSAIALLRFLHAEFHLGA